LAMLIASGVVSGIVLCPSNPWLSIDPILAVAPIAALLEARRVPVIAVSPIVAGKAVKGPAAKIMRELGAGVDVLGVVRHYGARVSHWVIDEQDAALAAVIERLGHVVLVADTIMSSPDRARELAADSLAMIGCVAAQ